MGKLSFGERVVHFEEDGVSGTAVVFIHGSCGAAAQWKRLAQNLASDFRTFRIDLPGCGVNEPWGQDEEWSRDVDTLAIDMLLQHIGDRVHAVVHSAGGNLAYESFLEHREQLLSLTMFEPTYFQFLRHNGSPQFAQPDLMARDFRRLMKKDDIDGAMTTFVDVWAKHSGTWVALPESIKSAMKRAANRLYFEWDLIHVDVPTLPDIDALDIPLILFKGSDTIDSMHEICETIRLGIPRCEYVEVEGAGHMTPFTHADQVTPMVREFMETHRLSKN